MYFITGIQQMGIGVRDVNEAWKWYINQMGFNIRIFEERATAGLMLPYTGGQPRERHAVLTINLQGGGGLEIWQYTEREPQPANFELQLGDLGIFSAKVKSLNVRKAYETYKKRNLHLLGKLNEDPTTEKKHFYVKDPYNNIFEIVESTRWFKEDNALTGGIYGASIGVSDMDKSIDFYNKILGYNEAVYDITGTFDDLSELPGGKNKFRRVLLKHAPRLGAFNKFYGPSKIELFQVLDRQPKKIYHERLWGDLGFIHLCFELYGMDHLKKHCQELNYPFTVDSSSSFDMGEAAGHFSYIEDPDGALIEFVETHKIPIIKKWGWYLDLRKRDPEKSLPDWMIRFLKYSKVKFKK